MRSAKLLCALLILLSLAPHRALAQGAQPNPANPNVLSDISCNGEGTSKELKALATLVVSGEITEEVRRCSQALSDEGKAQLFEIIAVERGLSIDELHEEARRDREALETRRISGYSPLGFWQQLLSFIGQLSDIGS